MDELEIAKVQNTINEIENQLSKYKDHDNSSFLLKRSAYQIKLLLMRIGYLEESLNRYQKANSNE